MFSQACVKNSVHRVGHAWGCMHGRGHEWQGACVAGVCMWHGGVCGRGMYGGVMHG